MPTSLPTWSLGGGSVARPGAVPPLALQQPGHSWASPWLRPWPKKRPRPSLEGQEAQAGLQVAPVSCQRDGIVRSDPCRVVPFPSLGASR